MGKKGKGLSREWQDIGHGLRARVIYAGRLVYDDPECAEATGWKWKGFRGWLRKRFFARAEYRRWLAKLKEEQRKHGEKRRDESERERAKAYEKRRKYWDHVNAIKARVETQMPIGPDRPSFEFEVRERLLDGGSYALPYGVIVEDTEGRVWELPEDLEREDGTSIRHWPRAGERIRIVGDFETRGLKAVLLTPEPTATPS